MIDISSIAEKFIQKEREKKAPSSENPSNNQNINSSSPKNNLNLRQSMENSIQENKDSIRLKGNVQTENHRQKKRKINKHRARIFIQIKSSFYS